MMHALSPGAPARHANTAGPLALKRARRALALAALAGVVVLSPACRAKPGYAGREREILATYRWRTLTCDLPADVRVPSAVAAAKVALAQRGYAVTQAEATEDHGRVEAEPYNPDLLETVVVAVRHRRWDTTRIEVRVEPAGDHVRSRAILDGVLAELGL